MDEYRTLQGPFSSLFEPDDDLNKYDRLWIQGTCEWKLHENDMSDFISKPEGCHLIWFSAALASGKSVLSAHVVTTLQHGSLAPQYFFFNLGDQHKRSVAKILRSIACQIAKENCAFRRGLLDLSKQGLRVDKADASPLQNGTQTTIFLVHCRLDECHSPKLLLDLIRTCSSYCDCE